VRHHWRGVSSYAERRAYIFQQAKLVLGIGLYVIGQAKEKTDLSHWLVFAPCLPQKIRANSVTGPCNFAMRLAAGVMLCAGVAFAQIGTPAAAMLSVRVAKRRAPRARSENAIGDYQRRVGWYLTLFTGSLARDVSDHLATVVIDMAPDAQHFFALLRTCLSGVNTLRRRRVVIGAHRYLLSPAHGASSCQAASNWQAGEILVLTGLAWSPCSITLAAFVGTTSPMRMKARSGGGQRASLWCRCRSRCKEAGSEDRVHRMAFAGAALLRNL